MTRTSAFASATRGSERRDPASREALRRRIESYFEDQRGLRLTLPQARRLFHVREDICDRVLAELIGEGRIERNRDGQYRRKDVMPDDRLAGAAAR